MATDYLLCNVTLWHGETLAAFLQPKPTSAEPWLPANSPLRAAVLRNHYFNCRLWREEDLVRQVGATEAEVALGKRQIDGFNQRRNDAVESIDDLLLAQMPAPDLAAGGSESGCASHQLLRVAHMPDAAEVRAAVTDELEGRPYLVIHADTKPFKMWPLAHGARLLQRIWAAEPECRLVIVGYPAIDIGHYAHDERLIDCRDLPLVVAYELIAGARLLIAIDSCMLHAADLLRVPTVAIFTEGFPAQRFGLLHSLSRTLVGANPPDGVTVDAVYAAYRAVIAASVLSR